MSNQDHDSVYDEFYELVNMQPKELQEWLETDASKSVGDSDTEESTGHRSGRRIEQIKRTKKADLQDDDYEHMVKVNAFIKRHTAQQPQGDVEKSNWRYSLKNWGHDPLKP